MNIVIHKVSVFLVSIFLIISLAPPSLVLAEDKKPDQKKVVILIIDYIDTGDLINAHTPNFDKLMARSGVGLMNIRAKNRYPASSYMSLATGYRVGTISNSGLAYNSNESVSVLPGLLENSTASSLQAGTLYSLFTGNEFPSEGVVNLFIEPARKFATSFNPAYQVGSLGLEARELGLNIAILGNSDTRAMPGRNSAILAMDERGIIPQGNISQNLLEANSLSPGGLRTNHERMINNMVKLLAVTDILVMDLGDTSRVELSRSNTADDIVAQQRRNAIERNDKLLGRILDNLNMNKTMLIALSPNPNKEMLEQGNFGLTPALVYTPGSESGLLTSSTTRRPGLVSNSDLKSTVFSYLEHNYPGVGISTIKSDSNLLTLNQQLNLFKQLRASRNPLHYTFMFFAVLSMVIGALAFIAGRQKFLPYVNYIVYCTLSIPIVFLFISCSNYFSLGGVILITFATSLLIAVVTHSLFKQPLDALLFLTSITAILLTVDSFTGSRLMLLSPLGSDAIAGGRFYGIGNDYMGVFLSSAIIATSLLLDRLKTFWLKPVHKATLGLIPLAIVSTAIGHPLFGTNMGGFITALVSMGFFFIITANKKISVKSIILVVTLAVLGVLGIAQLDAIFNPAPSHAGKAISNLHSGAGAMVLFLMIKTKLGILGSTVYHSAWSLILLLLIFTMIVLKRKAPNNLLKVAVFDPAISKSAKILLITAITVFIVNDTGVIAAALTLLYLISSLWLALSSNNHQNQARTVV